MSGWPAVAWVSGLGAALLVGAGIVYLRARGIRDRAASLPSYRSEGHKGSNAGGLRDLAFVLLFLFAISQLLYLGLYIELVGWLLGGRDSPRIFSELFFWVLLIFGTFLGGAMYSAAKGEF